jgi:hypothetical protein
MERSRERVRESLCGTSMMFNIANYSCSAEASSSGSSTIVGLLLVELKPIILWVLLLFFQFINKLNR